MEPRGNELIERYKKNYNIPSDANISEEMILAHWELEKQLTLELLQSKPEDRWEIFDQCYTRLYTELAWLNKFSDKSNPKPPHIRFAKWLTAIGQPPKRIYEIGSGTGALITFLAKNGYDCKATEITRERGEKHITESFTNLSWGITDGIHLEQFEEIESYDVVISNQVIEHMHPEDVGAHMKGVYSILKDGGRYIFSTPNRYTGPHDVSRVFKLNASKGMHLKEYTYRELFDITKEAGFSHIYFAFIPTKLRNLLHALRANRIEETNLFGILFLRIAFIVEKILSLSPSRQLRRACAKGLRKLYLFSDNISLVAEK